MDHGLVLHQGKRCLTSIWNRGHDCDVAMLVIWSYLHTSQNSALRFRSSISARFVERTENHEKTQVAKGVSSHPQCRIMEWRSCGRTKIKIAVEAGIAAAGQNAT
eukprot:TRINITY_DN31427_c0_g1_i1.p1 TRINITY_DN31427_c0_g1~~TRINITY_DN31427_c0_g1_i1.p1  ORF type:complete len:105 (-),score=14.48 TRINITY_DN31427_c0_g1_i1:165-479(-)